VLGKEIIIGKRVGCILYLYSGKESMVIVPVMGLSHELRNEIIEMAVTRKAAVVIKETEIRIL
jgi:hypothetical protein